MLAIALIYAHDLYVDINRPGTPWPPPSERIQLPQHHQWAKRALARFAALPPRGRAILIAELERARHPFPEWLTEINRQAVSVLCVGENHDPYLRRFLADRLFATLKADILLIETTAREAGRMRGRVESNRGEVRLLGADIARLLRRAVAANPGLVIAGIEERREQLSARRRQGTGSRERSIEANFRAVYQPGHRHVVLYGAFHCSHRGGWLFRRLRERPPPGTSAESLMNLRVAWEHLEGPFEAFTYFLDELGFPPGDFVITNTEALSAEIADWFPFLSANELRAFGAIAVFRNEGYSLEKPRKTSSPASAPAKHGGHPQAREVLQD